MSISSEFWKNPVRIGVDDVGMLDFPENFDEIERYSYLLKILPDCPRITSDPMLTKEENLRNRQLIIIRHECLCAGLVLPYLRDDFPDNSLSDDDFSFWKSLREDFIQIGGDIPTIFAVCKQKINLDESLGKKFSAFPLAPQDLASLESTGLARKVITQSKMLYMNGRDYASDPPHIKTGKIMKFDEELENCTTVLWKVLTLNSDYISPKELREIKRATEGDTEMKRGKVLDYLKEFRLKEYERFVIDGPDYKLPRKF